MNDSSRRKRKRKPTLNGRFINSSMAYELSLVKLAIEAQSDFISSDFIPSDFNRTDFDGADFLKAQFPTDNFSANNEDDELDSENESFKNIEDNSASE